MNRIDTSKLEEAKVISCGKRNPHVWTKWSVPFSDAPLGGYLYQARQCVNCGYYQQRLIDPVGRGDD